MESDILARCWINTTKTTGQASFGFKLNVGGFIPHPFRREDWLGKCFFEYTSAFTITLSFYATENMQNAQQRIFWNETCQVKMTNIKFRYSL